MSVDESSAVIRFSYSNLTTPYTATHLHGPADPGTNGAILFDLDDAPRQADGSYVWTFAPSGTLTVQQIVDAIKSGRIYINVHSARYPSGEIRGHYRRVIGSSSFTPPSAPPPLPSGTPTPNGAARFLTQATYGPTLTAISQLPNQGFSAWMNSQFTAAPTSHVAYLDSVAAAGTPITVNETMEAFWQQALAGDDQLRARVATALSEIMVISANSALIDTPYAMSSYMDILNRNAFGNFRQLLKEVTLSPAMGLYLDMLGNDKEDLSIERTPNENYAREVLQLFSIGLYKLHPDGSLILDESGLPIPTYDQSVIEGFARVFTGWNWGGLAKNETNWANPSKNQRVPMEAWASHHSPGEKVLLNGVVLPAGQAPEKDLEDALDNIFNHPNVGPFLARQLIQRLVTSNPSPGYVYRVASVFNNNGQGVRGDLQSVVRAILLDYEARSADLLTQQGYGKQREPMIRFANLLRAFTGRAPSGKFRLWNLESPETAVGQNPLRAPSVFNFFAPNYSQPGAIANAGLVSPEFQITTETQAIGSANAMWVLIRYGWVYNPDVIQLDFSPFQTLASNPSQLVDQLNLLLMSGQMPTAMKTTIVNAVSALPAGDPIGRVRAAVRLIVTSPSFVIQK